MKELYKEILNILNLLININEDNFEKMMEIKENSKNHYILHFFVNGLFYQRSRLQKKEFLPFLIFTKEKLEKEFKEYEAKN